MFKRIYIILLLFTSLPVFAQIPKENNYKLSFPDNISSNSAFDISLIASNPYANADRLVLYFEPSHGLNFKNMELRSFENESGILCRKINFEGKEDDVYRADIDLVKNKIDSKSYFQLLIAFKADNISSADLKFSGIFKEGNETRGYIQSAGDSETEDSLKFSITHLKFYKPQKLAGNSIQFSSGSELNISLNNNDVKHLLTEFWIKISNKQTEFLKLIDKRSGETLCDISTNPFQMVSIQSQDQFSSQLVNPYFISRSNWYHFSILTSLDEYSLSVYGGNILIGKSALPSFIKAGDLQWNFENNSQNKSYQVDLLRFIDFNNDIEISNLNKNYLNFIGKDTRVLYQFNFDDEDELYLAKDRLTLTFNSIVFLKSDAPIFARAPELNVNLLGNMYELTWNGGDYKQAKYYFLEKSINNSDYMQVSSVEADNSYEKQYSLLDAKDPDAEVVFYRIKQVNSDGSVVYSSQVKIGQGTTEPFVVEQNYPNPFNPRTSIVVNLMEDSEIEITIYNLEGKEVVKLFKGFLTSGTHKFSFDASELSSGVYLYKVSTPDFSDTKKMILTK